MAFPNVKNILKIGSALSSYKLLLISGIMSRPQVRPLFRELLKPFVKDGLVAVKYRCYDRYFHTYIRMRELSSDFLSTRELGVNDVYEVDRSFHPDLVIDGGGNIGLFTLRAAAAASSSGDVGVKFVVCEPLPANIEQIRKHLERNKVQAEILPVCLGGTRGVIPFYCREAISSSFDASKPYDRVLEIPVILLEDAIGSYPAKRILIKLDIEGMEVEALSALLPKEQRPVYVVGELHDFALNAPRMEDLFRSYGWALEFQGIAGNGATFRGCSPAAFPLVDSVAGTKPVLSSVA